MTVVARISLVLGVLMLGGLVACGSDESKVERGLTVDAEEAAPMSDAEMDMTEAERRAQDEEEAL